MQKLRNYLSPRKLQRKLNAQAKKIANFDIQLVHQRYFSSEIAVNNSHSRHEIHIDFIDLFALFTRFSPARFGEQAVHINSL